MPKENNLKEERHILLMVSEGSVHSCLALLVLLVVRQSFKANGGGIVAHPMTTSKQREPRVRARFATPGHSLSGALPPLHAPLPPNTPSNYEPISGPIHWNQ